MPRKSLRGEGSLYLMLAADLERINVLATRLISGRPNQIRGKKWTYKTLQTTRRLKYRADVEPTVSFPLGNT